MIKVISQYPFRIAIPIILLTLTISCTNILLPSVEYNVEDSSSPLLRILNCEELIEFPVDWVLSKIIVDQGVDSNNDPFASCAYFGAHNLKDQPDGNYFYLYVRIISPTDSPFDQSYLTHEDIAAAESFDPSFMDFGKENYQSCLQNKMEVSCNIGVQYTSSVVLVRFWVNELLSKLQIENILNPILVELNTSLTSPQ